MEDDCQKTKKYCNLIGMFSIVFLVWTLFLMRYLHDKDFQA